MAQTEEMKQTQPMVTVVCITYAHEEFIAQALDSFLAQKDHLPLSDFVGRTKGRQNGGNRPAICGEISG